MSNNLPALISAIYAAAFFDAEGWIFISETKPNVKNRMKSPRFYLAVGIGNTNQEIIVWFKTLFGGNIHIDKTGKHTMFRWCINSQAALPFLNSVLPYLKIKRNQVLLGLYFQQECGKYIGRKGLSVQELSTRQSIKRWIKEEKEWVMR